LFSEKNPNKVRSVIGTFAGQNWQHFHRADGSGYQFLKDWVLLIDNINPQIAARLVTPLTRWRKYKGERREQMQECLVQIKRKSNLSKDVFEVVMKSLQ
jgi:aminopeptidase N